MNHKGAHMRITTISYSGSNPSMGPHNTKSSRSINMTKYQKEAEDFLDNTMVNGVISMRDYIQLHADKKSDEIQKVHTAYQHEDLASGERIIDLNIGVEGQPTVSLHDLRTFSLTGTGFNNFDKLIKEKGYVEQEPSVYELQDEIKPIETTIEPPTENKEEPIN